MNLKMWLAGGAILGLLGVNGFLLWRNSQVEAEVARVKSTTEQEISGIRRQAASTDAATRKTIEELNQSLTQSQTKATALANQASIVARKHAEKLVAGLAEQQKADTDKQAEKVAEVHADVTKQIGEVKQAAETNSGKITEVATEVGAVKTEVATTKSALESTIADLKSVRGDLGVQSGLIATNSKELAALRELGERNYYEFTLTKTARAVKVGGVVLSLRKTDTKRNRFNLDVMADDKKVEKKDKTVNEPVQFYVSRARQPYELVINEIGKDKVVGYLATPKVMQSRR
jgi:chromosome segregation ATPase